MGGWEKRRKKKLDWKEDKKEGRGFGGIFLKKKNYNYTSPQQIKNKIYHNSCGVNVKRKLNLLIKY